MKRSLILLLALVVSYIAASMLMMVVSQFLLDDPSTDAFSMFVAYTGTFVLTIVAMSAFGRSMGWNIPSPRPRVEKLNLPLIVLALLMIISIEILLSPLFALMPETDLSSLYDMMRGGLWAVFTGVLAAPILEEFLFRGILQSNLTKFLNPFVAIILASAIFGAVHMIPQQIISATLTAMIIGTIFYLTGSLMTAVVIHMLNNGIAYIQLMYFGEGADLTEAIFGSDSQFWITYTIAAILIAGMSALGVVRISKRIKVQPTNNRVANSAK